MKLVIVVGTRPEIIRLGPTINLARKLFNTTLIHTGQNFDHNLNQVFFKDLDIADPDYYLDCSRENLGRTVGDVIAKSYELFLKLNPDAVLILGDTNSCLSAYSAKRLKIPIFHIEAGNRCFDPNLPEETNRKIIDHISDVNMCYMDQAKQNLINEGISTRYLFTIGSPLPEIHKLMESKIRESSVLTKLNLECGNYFVWSSHREENIDNFQNFSNLVNSLNQLAQSYKKTIVFTVHPRTRKMIASNGIKFDPLVVLSEPLGLIDYWNLQKNSECVISDSGTVTEESTVLGFKAVLLRTSTEHPEGIESGNIAIGNIKWDSLRTTLGIVLNSELRLNPISSYSDLDFSTKVCKIISGYTKIVDKFVWSN